MKRVGRTARDAEKLVRVGHGGGRKKVADLHRKEKRKRP